MIAQNFAGLSLHAQSIPAGTAVNPIMAGGNVGMAMPPTMATSTTGMGSVGTGGMSASQRLMGTNINMRPVGFGFTGGLGIPSIDMCHGINPAVVQPKSHAFTRLGNEK